MTTPQKASSAGMAHDRRRSSSWAEMPPLCSVHSHSRVGRPALVEPDVLPALGADRVAEPLVGQLVGHRALARLPGVDRPGLGLERVADAVVVDDRAEGHERVGAEPALEEVDHARPGARGSPRWLRGWRGCCLRRRRRRGSAPRCARTSTGRSSKSPTEAVVEVAGLLVRGVPVPRGPAALRGRAREGRPLATAVFPCGTVISKLYEALSVGWSLTGYHVIDPSGSPTTMAPSRVVTQP